jgi:uncharacterized repeat protein (TIGR04138 family)
MKQADFHEALRQILERDTRYAPEAYGFVREALEFTIKLLQKPEQGPARHVSGMELLDGIRQYALQEYGPLTLRVLNHWGVRRGEDFGEIVFALVESGVLGKTAEDRREDFAGGYDFEAAFAAPFRPAQPSAAPPRRRAGRATPKE